MATDHTDNYMSLRSAAKYIDFSAKYLRKKLGEIPHTRVNGSEIRIRKSDLDAWMSSFRAARPATARELLEMVSKEFGL